ncbi:MAG: hypothetical protein ACPGU7_10280 [Gammaproteobacteria bacterium]
MQTVEHAPRRHFTPWTRRPGWASIIIAPLILSILMLVAGTARGQPPRTDLNGLRADLSAVIQALTYRVTGAATDRMGIVRFEPDSGRTLTQGGLTAFTLDGAALHTDRAVGGEPLHRRMSAVLRLSDALGRIAFVDVAADYLLSDRVLLIQTATSALHDSKHSDVRLLVVPAARLPGMKTLQRFAFDELYTLFAENALEPARIRGAAAGTRWVIGAFDRVRQGADSRLSLHTPNRAFGNAVEERFALRDAGWNAVLASGRFTFSGAAPTALFAVHHGADGGTRPAGAFQLPPSLR